MHRVFFGLKRVVRKLRVKFHTELHKKHSLLVTPAAYEVLRILHVYGAYEGTDDAGLPAGDGGIPRFLLVRLLGIAGPGLSRLLRPLENNGLIQRRRHPDDRRIVIVSLTDFGILEMTDVGEPFDEWMEARCRESFTQREEHASAELALFERYVWRARYVNKDRTPLLDPFKMAEARDFWGGWLRIQPPPNETAIA